MLADARAAFGETLRDANLRRAEAAFGLAWAGEWAFTVALGVIAFRDGGAAAVGLVALVRMLPSALLAPFATTVADRMRRERVLLWVGVVRALATGAAALVLALDGPLWAVYALAVAATVAFTVYRPAHSALLPTLSRRPEQLTSANVVRGMIDSISTLVGPLVAAVLLGAGSAALVVAVVAATSLWSGLLMALIRYEAPPRAGPAAPARRLSGATAAGFAAIRAHADVALLVGLALVQTFTRGALNVFTVVVALELFGTEDAGVGVLSAAVGAGAVVGSLGTSLLAGGRRLAAWFGVGVALWGLPLALIGAIPSEPAAIALLALVGVGNALVDVGLFTLPGRLVPDDVLARVFGVLESLIALSVGLGSIVTPLVIEALGLRGALVAIGLLGPVLALLAARRLRRLDATVVVRDGEIRLLRGVSLLRPLPMPAIEHLARGLERVRAEAGAEVVSQGRPGERFYVIAAGEAEVLGDGRRLRSLREGDFFGEIALLRRVPRTATVRASTGLELYSLDGGRFVPAVSGYCESTAEADAVVGSRLAAFHPRAPGA